MSIHHRSSDMCGPEFGLAGLEAARARLIGTRPARLCFPPTLERLFGEWLHDHALVFVRAHIVLLLLLYLSLVLVTCVEVLWLHLFLHSAHDLRVWTLMTVALGAIAVGFCCLALRPALDRWYAFYSGLSHILILSTASLCMASVQDARLHNIAAAVLVICFSVVFGTGLHRLRACLIAAFGAAVLSLALGLLLPLPGTIEGVAWFYALMLFGMSMLCLAMERVHRVLFLQECLLELDRKRLSELSGRLEEIARQDPLTALANRRHFDEMLNQEWDRARREELPLSLLFIDVDHFKAYNDSYGHPAGDACLCQVASALRAVLRRPGDLVARYGGEEFVLLLPNTDPEGALHTGERARAVVAALGIPHAASAHGLITASVGIASALPGDASSPASLMSAADAALYMAKAQGRNRVSQADSLATVLSILER